MKITKTTLSSEELLKYAFALKSAIRTLVQNDSRLTYQQSLHAIGLKAETSKWEISHRDHYSAISGSASRRRGSSRRNGIRIPSDIQRPKGRVRRRYS